MHFKKLEKVAKVLQEKGHFKESLSVDFVLHKVASDMGSPKEDIAVKDLEEAVEELPSFSSQIKEVSSKLQTFFRENLKEDSLIVDQLGKFSAPNKPTLKTFIRALLSLEKKGKPFSEKDMELLRSLLKIARG